MNSVCFPNVTSAFVSLTGVEVSLRTNQFHSMKTVDGVLLMLLTFVWRLWMWWETPSSFFDCVSLPHGTLKQSHFFSRITSRSGKLYCDGELPAWWEGSSPIVLSPDARDCLSLETALVRHHLQTRIPNPSSRRSQLRPRVPPQVSDSVFCTSMVSLTMRRCIVSIPQISS